MRNSINEKTTLVVDGNWLMMGRQFMLRDKFSITEPESVRESAVYELAELMMQSICVCLRTLGDIVTNVVFVADGKSWRRDIEKPRCLLDIVYKGNRVKKETTDWARVWRSIQILEERLRGFGVTVSVSQGIEGDDWCWWWSRKLNSEGTNVILWTIDEDVKQLVQKDKETSAWTGWYERKPGLYLSSDMDPGYKDDDDIDFFMTPSIVQSQAASILSKSIKTTYVNPATIINKKIYIGDGGDNILPAFTYVKGDKTYKATEKDMTQVVDFLGEAYKYPDWENTIGRLYESIINVKGKRLRGASVTTKEDFVEHVLYNRKMVWLDESQIPSEIQASMARVPYIELSPEKMHDMRYDWKKIMRENNEDLSALFDDEDLPF